MHASGLPMLCSHGFGRRAASFWLLHLKWERKTRRSDASWDAQKKTGHCLLHNARFWKICTTQSFALESVCVPYGQHCVTTLNRSAFYRYIIMHDKRIGGAGLSCKAPSGGWGLGTCPVKKWSHIVAVYTQGGNEYMFLNGKKSKVQPRVKHDGHPGFLMIGCPTRLDTWLAHTWPPPASTVRSL